MLWALLFQSSATRTPRPLTLQCWVAVDINFIIFGMKQMEFKPGLPIWWLSESIESKWLNLDLHSYTQSHPQSSRTMPLQLPCAEEFQRVRSCAGSSVMDRPSTSRVGHVDAIARHLIQVLQIGDVRIDSGKVRRQKPTMRSRSAFLHFLDLWQFKDRVNGGWIDKFNRHAWRLVWAHGTWVVNKILQLMPCSFLDIVWKQNLCSSYYRAENWESTSYWYNWQSGKIHFIPHTISSSCRHKKVVLIYCHADFKRVGSSQNSKSAHVTCRCWVLRTTHINLTVKRGSVSSCESAIKWSSVNPCSCKAGEFWLLVALPGCNTRRVSMRNSVVSRWPISAAWMILCKRKFWKTIRSG